MENTFNPDVRKQAQEVVFSRKQVKSVHPDLVFNKFTSLKNNFDKPNNLPKKISSKHDDS